MIGWAGQKVKGQYATVSLPLKLGVFMIKAIKTMVQLSAGKP
jgi:hypothetical protein